MRGRTRVTRSGRSGVLTPGPLVALIGTEETVVLTITVELRLNEKGAGRAEGEGTR